MEVNLATSAIWLLPLTFCLHDAEEALMLHTWLRTHGAATKQRYALTARIIDRLSKLSTKAFIIAALEELVILVFATLYLIADGPLADYVWLALAMAFTLHLLIHIFKSIVLRVYVPGSVSSIALLPYSLYLWHYIYNYYSIAVIVLLALTGIAFMAINLLISHRLGLALTHHN